MVLYAEKMKIITMYFLLLVSVVAASMGAPRGSARQGPSLGLKGLLRSPTHTLKHRDMTDGSDRYTAKENDVWTSLQNGVQTIVTVETAKYALDEARALFRRCQYEQQQISEVGGVLSALMLATGLSIGICFDWAIKEIFSNSSPAEAHGILSPVILLIIFVLFHGAAAWEASNIYASVTKRRWESIELSNQFPKGCLMVGIATAPIICLGCFLLGRLGLVALPVLREVAIILRDVAAIFLEVVGDSLRALSTLFMAFFFWVKALFIRGSGR